MSSVVEVKLTLLLHLVLPHGLHLMLSFVVVLRKVEGLNWLVNYRVGGYWCWVQRRRRLRVFLAGRHSFQSCS